MRGIKRPPEVPTHIADLNSQVSKADLLELAYDFAVRLVGEQESTERPALVRDEIVSALNGIYTRRGSRKEIQP